MLKLKSIRLKLGDSLDHSKVDYRKAFFGRFVDFSLNRGHKARCPSLPLVLHQAGSWTQLHFCPSLLRAFRLRKRDSPSPSKMCEVSAGYSECSGSSSLPKPHTSASSVCSMSDFSEETINFGDPANIVKSSILTTFGHLDEAFHLEPINNEKIISG